MAGSSHAHAGVCPLLELEAGCAGWAQPPADAVSRGLQRETASAR